MEKRIFYILLLCIMVSTSRAQTGGDNVYEFLNLTHSGLVSSLGGKNVSIPGSNPNMAYHNPALLNSSMNNAITLNYVNYFAGINYGLAMWSKSLTPLSTIAAGLTYLNYGSFTESDPSGNITGTFSAAEYAFPVIYSRKIDSLFSVGITVKPIVSHLERYTSLGIAADIGALYQSRTQLFSAGLVIRNAGLQITSYAGEPKENPPFEIQAGVTQRLAHAPLRLSLTLSHLEKFDLTYQYIQNQSSTASVSKVNDFAENIMRHVIVGVELMPHKNFYLSGGYNYQRRSELQIDSRGSGAGLSWGFGINTSWLSVEFGRATYHIAGSSNHFSLIIRPGNIYRRSGKNT